MRKLATVSIAPWHLLLPVLMIAMSVLAAPRVLQLAVFDPDLQDALDSTVPLYRRGALHFHYTKTDLLHPPDGNALYDGVAFELYPTVGEEATSRQLWPLLISRALAGRDHTGDPLAAGGYTADDLAISTDFLGRFEGPRETAVELRLGDLQHIPVADDATYRAATGIGCFMALAVRPRGAEGRPPVIAVAELSSALGKIVALDGRCPGRGLGIPYMSLTRGPRPLSTGDSWIELMQVSDQALSGSRVEHVVFGGWNVKPDVSLRKHEEFAEAWPVYRRQLLQQPNAPVHETIRMAALVWLVALLADRWRRRPATLLRVSGLLVLCGGLGIGVVQLSALTSVLLPWTSEARTSLVLECAYAVAAGLLLEVILWFRREVRAIGDRHGPA